MFFAPGNLEPPAFYALLHSKILPEAERIEAIVPWARQRYLQSVAVIDNALGGNDYLLGDDFTAADIMVGSTLMWLPDSLNNFPQLQAYVDRLQQRKACIRAVKPQ